MDIFEKCINFTRADDVKKLGVYPYFRAIEENEGPVVKIEGRTIVMAGSNNYLGLTAHPRVREASINAIKKYGSGCSGSRYLTGTIDLHIELEHRLAKFLGFEEVLLYSTGYQTALGAIPTLAVKGDYLILDKEDHASIVNAGMIAKGAFTEFKRYKHNDMEDLESVLKKLPMDAGKLIVSDGVFSVTGEIVNLPELLKIAKKYNARVMVDDAHAIGVIGKGGRGTASKFGVTDQTDLVMGTFSKTFSSLGGFVAGPERVINFLKHHSPALIFSASPTPASCAAALASLDILEEQPELVDKLVANSKYMQKGFKDLGLNIVESETGIVPVIVGDVDLAFLFWRKLYDNGVFVNAFIPPGVPPHMSMMRTSYMATHEKVHLDMILDAFDKVAKELNLI
ncbi:pyridoxal phosphate-dependent aminotransferase family protein [Bacteroidetes/Chlorobi group bacterium ChocPot_Mid]|nr:MAG: pyridoxal phosphate-dependent aminotransferase family protein [Bacteroidetes/Chlorobi group bacterium ChocPot_Mid]